MMNHCIKKKKILSEINQCLRIVTDCSISKQCLFKHQLSKSYKFIHKLYALSNEEQANIAHQHATPYHRFHYGKVSYGDAQKNKLLTVCSNVHHHVFILFRALISVLKTELRLS